MGKALPRQQQARLDPDAQMAGNGGCGSIPLRRGGEFAQFGEGCAGEVDLADARWAARRCGGGRRNRGCGR